MQFVSAVGPQNDIINNTSAPIEDRARAIYEHATSPERQHTLIQFTADDVQQLTEFAATKYGLTYTVMISAPGMVCALVRVS